MAESTVDCPVCREVNKQGTVACARCGRILLSDDQMKHRRAQIEQWKRETERESVDYPTMANLLKDRLSGNPQNMGKYFDSISNYRKRTALLCLLVPSLIAVLWVLATRH
jgi:uncharacterized Zn finger protein (UPF0148 family)